MKGMEMGTVRKEFFFQSQYSGTKIHVIQWIPDQPIIGILQIAHGMVEYIERYEEFATYLNQYGILVVGNDHLGHGSSVNSKEDYGFFGDKNGSDILVHDMHSLRSRMQEAYPSVPYFMLGHSMGSFLLRKYITKYESGLAGVIIMGTGYFPSFILKIGKAWTYLGALLYGWNRPAKTLDGILFTKDKSEREDDYTNSWLSKETEIVRRYKEDERSQFVFTYNGYYCLFDTIDYLTKKKHLRNMDADIPVLILSGQEDKLGMRGHGVTRFYRQLKKYPIHDIQLHLFPGDRHELLNETDREEIYERISQWIRNKLVSFS
jgi:alpha-beta hydrolase superfamily lysophospholipase